MKSLRGLNSIIGLIFDAAVVYLGISSAIFFRFGNEIPELDRAVLTFVIPTIFLTRLGAFYAAGIYRRSFIHPRIFDYSDMLQAWASGTVILVAVIFFGRVLETSRLFLVYEAIANFILATGWRAAFSVWGRRVAPVRKAVFVGSGLDIERLNFFLEREGWEFRISRSVSPEEWERGDEEILIVRTDDANPGLIAKAVGMDIVAIAGMSEILLSGATPIQLGGTVFLETRGVRNDRHYLAAKRSFDIVAAAFGLILFSPLIILISMAIKLTSKGSVFFIQKRVGIRGKEFRIIKFRTMRSGSKGPGRTEENDSRVTSFGRFLRLWSLDELPQLLNVLIGNMSIVGPRPEILEVVEKWSEWRKQVLMVQPGITGLVQVLGRDELSEEEKERLDLFYAMNRSLEMDVSIILRTLRSIVKYRGKA